MLIASAVITHQLSNVHAVQDTSAEHVLLMQAQAHSLALPIPEQLCLSPASLQITIDEYVLGALPQTRRTTPSGRRYNKDLVQTNTKSMPPQNP